MVRRASFTSSSLKGLTIAVISFIRTLLSARRRTVFGHGVCRLAVLGQVQASDLVVLRGADARDDVDDLKDDERPNDGEGDGDAHTDDLLDHLARVAGQQAVRA